MDCFVKIEPSLGELENCLEDNFILDFFDNNVTSCKSIERPSVKIEENFQLRSQQRAEDKIAAQTRLLSEIQNHLELKTAHSTEINKVLNEYYFDRNYNKKKLMRILLKRKLFLKRSSAKLKVCEKKSENSEILKQSQDFYEIVQEHKNTQISSQDDKKKQDKQVNSGFIFVREEEDIQKKKKRNRVSAQVSRDKKKQYLKNLQMQQKRLESIQQNYKLEVSKNMGLIEYNNNLQHELNQQKEMNMTLKMQLRMQSEVNCDLSSENQILKKKLMQIQALLKQDNLNPKIQYIKNCLQFNY